MHKKSRRGLWMKYHLTVQEACLMNEFTFYYPGLEPDRSRYQNFIVHTLNYEHSCLIKFLCATHSGDTQSIILQFSTKQHRIPVSTRPVSRIWIISYYLFAKALRLKWDFESCNDLCWLLWTNRKLWKKNSASIRIKVASILVLKDSIKTWTNEISGALWI